MKKQKVIFSWSGGKDSSLCLHYILQQNKYEVCYLLTSLNGDLKRVSMHGVHETLLEAQAKSIGIPLKKVYVYETSDQEYEQQMTKVLSEAKAEGVTAVVFGDIFLEDLRAYREEKMTLIGMQAIFPLWKRDTKELIGEFIDLDFKTIVCCGNDAYLQKEQVGKQLDKNYLLNLAPDVDPCGENGEYHTYCYEGPIFKVPIHVKINDSIYKPLDVSLQQPDKNNKTTKGFWYADLELN